MAQALPFASVGLGLLGIVQQKKAGKEQKKATARQRRISDIENARSRRRAVAASRRGRAQAIASAATSGGLGSSGLSGFTGGLSSAVAGNISSQNQLAGLEQSRLSALGSAASFSSSAATFSALGDLAGSDGIRDIAGTFGSTT